MKLKGNKTVLLRRISGKDSPKNLDLKLELKRLGVKPYKTEAKVIVS